MTAVVMRPDLGVQVHRGLCLDVLREMAENSVDSVVTDPPYSMSFMGRAWDSHGGPVAYEEWCREWAVECLRILKPGGHLLAFGGARTHHRLTSGIEDAGFEVRDSITWLYGTGFPKSLDVSKAIDKAAGAERGAVGKYVHPATGRPHGDFRTDNDRAAYSDFSMCDDTRTITAPSTADAKTWQGWGTALKPAGETIVVARKPLSEKTVAANVLAHGTGAINVDACRIAASDSRLAEKYASVRNAPPRENNVYGVDSRPRSEGALEPHVAGRWPTNVVLSHVEGEGGGDACAEGCVPGCAVAELDGQSGTSKSPPVGSVAVKVARKGQVAKGDEAPRISPNGHGDSGCGSRFFPTFRYTAKASTRERPKVDGIAHPTCKPLALMRWLLRLVTPPGGICVDPFAGSGTTVEAAILEGFRCIAIEAEAAYLPLIDVRIARAEAS